MYLSKELSQVDSVSEKWQEVYEFGEKLFYKFQKRCPKCGCNNYMDMKLVDYTEDKKSIEIQIQCECGSQFELGFSNEKERL